jgi:hypothetical protein
LSWRIPRGKYKGWLPEQIPTEDLRFYVALCQRRGWFRRWPLVLVNLELELAHREGRVPVEGVFCRAEDVHRWYRDLAREFHPDCGGSTEKMQALNEAWERLRRLLGL